MLRTSANLLVCVFGLTLGIFPAEAEERPGLLLAETGQVIGGKTMAAVGLPQINNSGEVVFGVRFPGTGDGIVRVDATGQPTLLAGPGDDIDDKTLDHATEHHFNNSGEAVFRGHFSGEHGIFHVDASHQATLLIARGDVIDGKRVAMMRQPWINNSGEVVFWGRFDGPGAPPFRFGILHLDADGHLTPLVTEGEEIDGNTLLENELHFDMPQINDAGEVVFRAEFATGEPGIFHTDAANQTTLLAATGDVIDGKALQSLGTHHLNNSGEVVFRSQFSDGHGIFHIDATRQATLLAAPGDEIGSDGRTVGSVLEPLHLNDFGEVVFRGAFGESPGGGGIFRIDVTGQITPLVVSGDKVDGKTIQSFRHPQINNSGEVVFEGVFSGGRGIFLLPPNHEIPVTPLSQTDPEWAGDLYAGHPRFTIGEQGCALVSLSMALNEAGITGWTVDGAFVPNDPGTLNQLLTQRGGYSGLSVHWGDATKIAAQAAGVSDTVFNTSHWKSSSPEDLRDIIFEERRPVVLRVPLDPDHFVLVTGIDGDSFHIIDPLTGDRANLREAYGDDFSRFEIRGFIDTPPNDRSTLAVAAAADVPGVELSLIAPDGSETGFDAPSDTLHVDIPGSAYFVDSIGNALTGEGAVDVSHQVPVFQPEQGEYTVVVSGPEPALYVLDIAGYAPDGTAQGHSRLTGLTGPGSVELVDLHFSKEPGEEPLVRRDVTFESLLDELDNAFALELIGNRGILRSLGAKIEAAQRALERDQPEVAASNLEAFLHQVEAQSGKQIAPEAADIFLDSWEVLIEDLAEAP